MLNLLPSLLSDECSQLLFMFGLIFIYKILKSLSKEILWFITTYAPHYYRPYDYIKKYGDWAAITGCTGGIGLDLAKEIARRGTNLVLISRSIYKLKALSRELESEFNIKTKIIVNDATDRQSSLNMAEDLSKMDIGIIVNNVGINFETSVQQFNEQDPGYVYKMITVNTANAALTMKYVLPNMIKKRRGLIVNICSTSAYFPVPLQSLYSGTKVYMDILGQSIETEVNPYGVKIQSVCPLLVQSNMTAHVPIIHNIMSLSAPVFAKSTLNKLATCKKTSGHWFFDAIIILILYIMNPSLLLYLLYFGTKFVKIF